MGQPVSYKPVLHSNVLVCSNMNWVTRCLLFRKMKFSHCHTAFRYSTKICLRDGSGVFMTSFLSFWNRLTGGRFLVTWTLAVSTQEFHASVVMLSL